MKTKLVACFALSLVIWGSAVVLAGTAVKRAIAADGAPTVAAMAPSQVG